MTLATRLFVERTDTDINGRARRTLMEAGRGLPGYPVVHVIDWRNDSSEPVQGLTVTRALPAGARLEAAAQGAIVSVDGGNRWGRLDQLWMPTPLGGVRRATIEDVTHVRWRLTQQIAPGAAGRVSYRTTSR